MYAPDIKPYVKKARRHCLYFLLTGVISAMLALGGNRFDILGTIETANAILLTSIAVTGFLTTYGDYKFVSLYVLFLSIYGTILTAVYVVTSFLTLGVIIAFPDCNDNVNPGCQVEKDTSLALIGLLALVVVFEFYLNILFIFTYKNAKLMEEAIK